MDNDENHVYLVVIFPNGEMLSVLMTDLKITENLHSMIINGRFEGKLSPDQQVMISNIFKRDVKEWYRSREDETK